MRWQSACSTRIANFRRGRGTRRHPISSAIKKRSGAAEQMRPGGIPFLRPARARLNQGYYENTIETSMDVRGGLRPCGVCRDRIFRNAPDPRQPRRASALARPSRCEKPAAAAQEALAGSCGTPGDVPASARVCGSQFAEQAVRLLFTRYEWLSTECLHVG